VCNAKGGLHCHEIWEYDDENHIQKLKGFIALCVACHEVKHLMRSRLMADENQLDYEKLISHFMTVNQCSREAFDEYQARVFAEYQVRSESDWTVDFGEYQKLISPGNDLIQHRLF
jgi:hypothetical protein